MKLTAQTDFSWAHRGVEVEHFKAGAEIESDDDDLIAVSISEGWTISADVDAPAAVEAAATVEAPPADEAAAVETPAPAKRGRAAK